MNPNQPFRQTFDRVIVINLPRRTERLAQFNQSFKTWPFTPPQRFPAIDGQQLQIPSSWTKGPGALGCALSHQAVLSSAIADKVSSLFVLEDDACPVPDFPKLAADFLARVPNDWDCLAFGAEHLRPPTPVSPGIVQCTGANRTHAYAVRGKFMPILLAYWKSYNTEHCDIILASLMQYFHVYAPDPFLIGQAAGHSDITNRPEPLRFLSPTQIDNITRQQYLSSPSSLHASPNSNPAMTAS